MPISLGSLWVPPDPGIIPRLISGQPILVSSEAILKSQANASSQPPPKTKPNSAAIVGFSISATLSIHVFDILPKA